VQSETKHQTFLVISSQCTCDKVKTLKSKESCMF